MTAAEVKTAVGAFVEVYRIRPESLAPLFAWQVEAADDNPTEVARKLSPRFRLKFGSHWVWTDQQLVTDAQLSQDDINTALQELWAGEVDIFKTVRSVTPL